MTRGCACVMQFVELSAGKRDEWCLCGVIRTGIIWSFGLNEIYDDDCVEVLVGRAVISTKMHN